MNKKAILFVSLLAPLYLFSQRPFAPIGAKWGGVEYCVGDFYPCPPYFPRQHVFEVTKDTVIQGKYCTLIDDQDWEYWGAGSEYMIVHQDGHKIYRYDRDAEVFKLVLDFSKEVGESWQIEVPSFWGSSDTFTITVLEKDGDFRKVSVEGIFTELELYEGIGGILFNKRLLLGINFFIHADPSVWDVLTCYIDPNEGLLYGSASGCIYNSTDNPEIEEKAFSLYPNPASYQVVLESSRPLTRVVEWILSDVLGQTVQIQKLSAGTTSVSILLEALPDGIYFWKIASEGKTVEEGKVVIVR